MPPKKAAKAEEKAEEDVAVTSPDEEVQVEEPTPDPFERLHEVWAAKDTAEQRRLVSEIFSLPDGPGLCIESIVLDNVFADLTFAKKAAFSLEQTRVFYEIMQGITEQLKQPNTTLDGALQDFKIKLIANCAVSSADIAAANAPPPAPEPEPEPEPEAAPEVKGKGGKKGGKGDDKKEEEEAPAPAPAPQKPQPRPKVLRMQNVKSITDYVTTGVFGNFLLYQLVFNRDLFEQRKNVHVENVRVEEIMHDDFKLEDAVQAGAGGAGLKDSEQQAGQQAAQAGGEAAAGGSEAGAQQEAEEELDDDPISRLVRKHVTEARANMLKTLEENEANLETRLKAIEAGK